MFVGGSGDLEYANLFDTVCTCVLFSFILLGVVGIKVIDNHEISVPGTESASSVDDAIALLGGGGGAASSTITSYAQYERSRMPSIKAENPEAKASQLREWCKKEWSRSPKNPKNQ